MGGQAGAAIKGFVNGAPRKTAGEHPDVTGWYATFLRDAVLPHVGFWAHLVAWGEVLVGVGLILGVLTGIAAFFGGLMNVNYLLAGTISSNPLLFVLATWLVLAWRGGRVVWRRPVAPAAPRNTVGTRPLVHDSSPVSGQARSS